MCCLILSGQEIQITNPGAESLTSQRTASYQQNNSSFELLVGRDQWLNNPETEWRNPREERGWWIVCEVDTLLDCTVSSEDQHGDLAFQVACELS